MEDDLSTFHVAVSSYRVVVVALPSFILPPAENTENRAPAVVEKVQEPVQKEPEVVKPSVAPTTNQAAPPNNVPMSNNKFASGSNPNAGNVITGRPSSRVLAPPGGPSSGPLW
jgi:hypothetical protein